MINDRNANDNNVVSRYSKKKPASPVVTTFSLVKRLYPNAIEITGVPPGTRGLLLLVGLFSALIALVSGNQIVQNLITRDEIRVSHVVTSFFYLVIILFGIYITAFSIRLELFKPEDEPLIFDRKNRKIYRLFREKSLSWKEIFRPWPLRVAEHDWDLVDAEHHVSVNANTSTVSRVHALIFQVRKDRSSSEIIDGFSIGSSMQMGELTVPAVWEYIRRFMEEDGEHLPSGERQVEAKQPSSLWESLKTMGLYGSNLKRWWNSNPVLTVVALIFSPIVYPILALLGLFVWLAYKTSTPINWPEDILRRVGSPLE